MKLLFIEPNKTFRQIVGTMFADADIEIGFAATRQEAMVMLEDLWQFVCLARYLPDGDGLGICRELRTRPGYRHTPLILFTADADASLQREAAQAGATEVFLKSDVGDLMNFVSRYSARVRKFAGRILYVEDSPAQASVTRQVLEAAGLTIDWLSSAEQAWATFQRHDYDLVLTDLVLTDAMTGATLISRIRCLPDERGDTPIIAVTAFDQLARRIELFHLGVSDYVAKPIIEEELISRIRNLVERRKAERVIRREEKRRFDDTLVGLSRKLDTLGGDLAAAVADICQVSAAALGVARASVWMLAEADSEIRCLTSQVDGKTNPQALGSLRRADFPAYFAALLSERCIAAAEAWNHPATCELAEAYLMPLDIRAMLDIPLSGATQRTGVLCYEHLGAPRKWSSEEESFAAAVGDLVTLAIEAHERWRADQQLRLAGMVFEAADEAILICDRDNRILTANEAFTAITGYRLDEIVGKTPEIFKSGKHDAGFYAAMWHDLNSHGKWQGELWDKRKDGSEYPKRLSITQVLDGKGDLSHYIAVFTDISKEHDNQTQLQYLAYNDVLTDLPNRLQAEATLHTAMEGAEKRAASMAVLCVDLDRFNKINSSFGHGTGDLLLREAAKRLRGALPAESVLARWSGAGFLVILHAPADAAAAVTAAQRCIDAFRQPFQIDASELHVSLSVGIALYPQHGKNSADLIKNTVAAQGHAKDGGGNRHVFFTADMERHTRDRLMLESRLRRAIADRHFVVHYQPKMDATSLLPVGMEALVRWNDPQEGLIPPGRFIPLAEDTGQIYPINDWVLHEACRQNADWLKRGLALPVAVNLPAGAFAESPVADTVRRILADTGLPPSLLELELTESAMMDNPQLAVDVFTELKQLGVRIAIDDFGTGYSSLAYLRRFPIDILKIDRSFVTNINASDDEQVIVSTIIGLARSLKLRTVAEGIEREAQSQILRELGCDMFQGFLFGRPMPADDFFKRVSA